MKKNGFTLAEILIALLVVGILAALTIPPLVLNFRRAGYGAALSSTVSNFENAMTTMMIKENANDLYGTQAWKDLLSIRNATVNDIATTFVANIGSTIELDYLGDFNSLYDDDIGTLQSGVTATLPESMAFRMKTGAIVSILPNANPDPNAQNEADVLRNGGNLYAAVATVYIDVNGTDAPNIYGRDIFVFLLGSDGVLYPYGGIDVSVYTGLDDSNLWNKEGSSRACNDTINGLAWGCTGRLIENEYRMDY